MRKLFFGLIFIFTTILLWINFKLYSEDYTTDEEKTDIMLQLNFLEVELKNNNLGQRMQDVLPEGFVFTNVLYGLSWCELAISDSTHDKKLKEKALNEALYAYNEIDSDKAKSIFESYLIPENGIYYVGWKNYLLSKILLLDNSFTGSDKYKKLFIEECKNLTDIIKLSNTPFLQSYNEQTWPADMCVAMASISNYEKIYKPKYRDEINKWIKNVKYQLDPKTKMIPHKVHSRTGTTIEGARGSSSSLILRMLAEIEPSFAKEQYELYKTHFVTTTFGLPSVSEYPKGENGLGDIDSGPVMFGVGFSGTIVSISTFSILGDEELSQRQYKTINSFGFANRSGKEKKYIFGALPVADAFIAWGRASALNNHNLTKETNSYWRVKFHFICILISTVLWLTLFSKTLLSKIKSGQNKSK